MYHFQKRNQNVSFSALEAIYMFYVLEVKSFDYVENFTKDFYLMWCHHDMGLKVERR